MKLKDYISQKNVVLGNTEEGKAWALKALHPADPLTEVRGIPDESAVPSVFQNFQMTYNITNPTASTVGVWEFDLFLFPSPVILGALRTRDSAGAYLWSPIVNPQIGLAADQWYTRQATYADTVERYRVAYLGCTGHLDAAAVSNQGSIVVAQYPIESVGGNLDAALAQVLRCPLEIWNELPKTWDQLISMPNAYVAAAKDGFYCPYKLGRTCQKWRNARNLMPFIPYGNGSTWTTAIIGAPVPAGPPSLTTVSGAYPYGVLGWYNGCNPAQAMIMRRADDGVIHIAARNLHYQSAFQTVIRAGFETQVSPASQLSPFARISPRHDALAIDGYFAVAREFKDAYPEEYNGWEEILGVIGNAVGDVISTVVPGGNLIVKGAKAILPKILGSGQAADVTQMSATQKEQARDAVAASARSATKLAKTRRAIASTGKK
jgi:hypothetical protein